MKSLLFLVFVYSSLFLALPGAQAEPWLSNRYAQNCAACHAPGRFNLKPKKRRCTLSCQGCHVNPNGGGLRNEYGKWNQQRWLRSFYNKKYLGNKKTPAPDKYQVYMAHSKKLRDKYKGPKAGKKRKIYSKKPAKLVVSSDTRFNIANFNKYSNDDWNTNASHRLFMTRIPENDPYKLTRENLVSAGGDIRYFLGSYDVDLTGAANVSTKVEFDSVMAADVGVRIRPVKENVSLVFEHRTLSRGDQNWDNSISAQSIVRSAYMLVDDLAYNTWFQAGIYRPMFGLYDPNHNSLSNTLTGLNQRAAFKSFGVGTAPNVPFLNIHYITKRSGINTGRGFGPFVGDAFDQEGFNINTGLRFVTYSANVKLSYWSTKSTASSSPTVEQDKNMISITAGGKFGRFITNIEGVRWSVKNGAGEVAGNVYTADLKYRIWREIFGSFNIAQSNTFTDGSPGDVTELTAGLRGYIYSGIKGEVLFSQRNGKSTSGPGTDLKSSGLLAQLHFYF